MVRQAKSPDGEVAVKIIAKKNVQGESVYM